MFYFNILWLTSDLKYVWNDDLYGLEKYAIYKTGKIDLLTQLNQKNNQLNHGCASMVYSVNSCSCGNQLFHIHYC